MNNLISQYIRRIGKFIINKNDKPTVAIPGTNHVDDAASWTDKTIYQGEHVTNIYTGKTFTSDSQQIIELNSENCIIEGMQVMSIPGAASEADPLYVKVSNGYVRICGKTYRHKSIVPTILTPGDLLIEQNTSVQGRYDLVYASGDYPNKAENSDDVYKAKLTVIKGVYDINELYDTSIVLSKLQGVSLLPDESVLLGIIYVPPFYNSLGGVNHLRPWSWGVSIDNNTDKDLNVIQSQYVNTTSITPGHLLDQILSRVFIHKDSGGNLRKRNTYLRNQLIVYENENQLAPDKKLYKVLNTHFCYDLTTSLANNSIAEINGNGGGSPGGVYNHSELNELTFDYSGHVGFQRITHVYDIDPSVDDCSAPPPGFVLANVGNLWLNTFSEQSFICVKDTPGDAKWVTALGDVKDTEDDKEIDALITIIDGDLAFTGGISHTPANDSYVKVEVNGIGVSVGDGVKINCDCYFSNDNGTTARDITSIMINDTLHWNGSHSFELDDEDKISLFYLINIPGTNTGAFEGPIWGGTSITP